MRNIRDPWVLGGLLGGVLGTLMVIALLVVWDDLRQEARLTALRAQQAPPAELPTPREGTHEL